MNKLDDLLAAARAYETASAASEQANTDAWEPATPDDPPFDWEQYETIEQAKDAAWRSLWELSGQSHRVLHYARQIIEAETQLHILLGEQA